MIKKLTKLSIKKIPHVFSRVDNTTRQKYVEKYIIVKKAGIYSSFGIFTLAGFASISKDILYSKLKAYSYKKFFSVVLGPVIQMLGLPMYIFSFGLFFRRYAIVFMSIGSSITRGEVELANIAWIIADFALFGEPIPITDEESFRLLSNETTSTLIDLFNKTFPDDLK